MRKWFSRVSVCLAFMLVLLAVPFMKAQAAKDDDLPEIPDVKITDGILSWGDMDGYYNADIKIEEIGFWGTRYAPKREYDLKDAAARKGAPSGTYKVTLKLYKLKNNVLCQLSKIWEGTYNYTCSGTKRGTVTNLVWNESEQKLTWKSSALGEGEEYKIRVNTISYVSTKPEMPLYYFLFEGTRDYEISVCIHKYGCPDGDAATITKKSYTHTLKPMDISIDEDGILSWKSVPNADRYAIYWSVKGTDSRSVAIVNEKATSYDVEKEVISKNCCGQEICVTIQAESYASGNVRDLSQETETSYVSKTQMYPLKYYDTIINSHNEKEYADKFQYDPDTKTLKFNDLDLSLYGFSGSYPLFYSSEDLTITGRALIPYQHMAIKCDKTLTFASGSDVSINTFKDAVAVYADKIVINGKNLLVNTENGTAMQAGSSITFGSAFNEGRFISGSGTSAVSVTASQGKISLGKTKIVLPAGGKLGADGRNICKSDGVTVASDVSIKSSSYVAPSDVIPIDEAHFPNQILRECIIGHYFDRNMDMCLDKQERESVKNLFVINDTGSEDVNKFDSCEGLKYFPELEWLELDGSSLTSLDLSNNPKMKYLTLIRSNVEYLDISNNPKLVDAYKLGKKETTYGSYAGLIYCYSYREDSNNRSSNLLSEIYISANITIDPVGPTPPTDISVEIGKSIQYVVSQYIPASSITWSVGNASVATVDANGNVTGKSIGNTYLYAKCQNGKTYKCLVRVVYPALKINYTEKTLHINQAFSFSVKEAYGQKITWSVGNTSVATVDANGKVTGKSAANTYLYAKSADGRVAKCLVKVIDPGTLGINYTEKTVYIGQTFTFTAKNKGILSVTWSVGNTAVAKVDSNGKVTPVSVGNTYLYAKTADGRSARCLVKVVDPGPLSIRYTEKTIKVGSSFKFTATNTAGQTVSWRVGNSAVATVDASGNVTGKSVANTYLYAKTPDGREVRCLLKIVA